MYNSLQNYKLACHSLTCLVNVVEVLMQFFFIDIGVALIKDNTFSITPDELLSFYSFNLLLCSISPQHQQSFSRTVCRYQLWRDQKEIGRK